MRDTLENNIYCKKKEDKNKVKHSPI